MASPASTQVELTRSSAIFSGDMETSHAAERDCQVLQSVERLRLHHTGQGGKICSFTSRPVERRGSAPSMKSCGCRSNEPDKRGRAEGVTLRSRSSGRPVGDADTSLAQAGHGECGNRAKRRQVPRAMVKGSDPGRMSRSLFFAGTGRGSSNRSCERLFGAGVSGFVFAAIPGAKPSA